MVQCTPQVWCHFKKQSERYYCRLIITTVLELYTTCHPAVVQAICSLLIMLNPLMNVFAHQFLAFYAGWKNLTIYFLWIIFTLLFIIEVHWLNIGLINCMLLIHDVCTFIQIYFLSWHICFCVYIYIYIFSHYMYMWFFLPVCIYNIMGSCLK